MEIFYVESIGPGGVARFFGGRGSRALKVFREA